MIRFVRQQRCPTCGGIDFTRRHRILWMRLFRNSRFFICRQCRTPVLQLAPRGAQDDQDLAEG